MKLTVKDVRNSRFPQAIGLCSANQPQICMALNEVVQRLIVDPRQPDAGWWGTWQQLVYNVTRSNPYLSTPRGVSRFELIDVCQEPIKINNEFGGYAWAGEGYLPKNYCSNTSQTSLCVPALQTTANLRGNYVTATDVPTTNPCYIRVYPTDVQDAGKRILIQGYDNNDHKIYGLSGSQQMEGFYMTLNFPFTDSTELIGSKGLYGIQKDWTYGDVPIYAVDSVTGAETALSRYEPGETNPVYQRYYFDSLPQWCCSGTTNLQVNILAKRDYYPVSVDQDWVLIGNLPALIAEAQAIYHDGIQEASASVQSLKKHTDAIAFLQGELDHYLGKENPAIVIPTFGTAKLEYRLIGSML